VLLAPFYLSVCCCYVKMGFQCFSISVVHNLLDRQYVVLCQFVSSLQLAKLMDIV
jgi:hypothetical protein